LPEPGMARSSFSVPSLLSTWPLRPAVVVAIAVYAILASSVCGRSALCFPADIGIAESKGKERRAALGGVAVIPGWLPEHVWRW
jgi:hypothetical protein